MCPRTNVLGGMSVSSRSGRLHPTLCSFLTTFPAWTIQRFQKNYPSKQRFDSSISGLGFAEYARNLFVDVYATTRSGGDRVRKQTQGYQRKAGCTRFLIENGKGGFFCKSVWLEHIHRGKFAYLSHKKLLVGIMESISRNLRTRPSLPSYQSFESIS